MELASKYTLVAIQAALKAGNVLISGYDSNFSISEKEGHHNLVTEYDLKSEKTIISTIRHNFPDHEILSEECGILRDKKSPFQWIIDPLDGTVNFAHSIPIFAISIALAIEGEVICGVIYHPITKEMFIAQKNEGIFLNGNPISVTDTTNLVSSFLATGFPYNRKENPHNCIGNFTKALKKGIPIRRLGVASLDLAYVAAGRFDGYWEVGLKPWDCAAGILMVEEAKGKVSQWDGNPYNIFSNETILTSNSHIHKELQDMLAE